MAALELPSTTLINDANLIAYYRCQGNANDEKGSFNGTATDITFSDANGKFGNGAGYNGTTSKIVLAKDMVSAYPFTVLMWVNLGNVTGASYLLTDYSGSSTIGFDILVNGNVVALGISGTADVIHTTDTLSTSAYTMLTCVFNGASSAIYFNDTSKATGTLGAFTKGTNKLRIGGRWSSDTDTGDAVMLINGAKVDEVAFFTRALSGTEIANHYNGTDALVTETLGKIYMTTNTRFF